MLQRRLSGVGAVLIEGPKWCGKTTTASQHAKTILYLDDPTEMSQYLRMADINPKALLQGNIPLLIDEWQLAPKLWDTIRYEVDRRGEPGQFVLTGSAVPAQTDDIHHSGTGRFAWLTMRPMSLYESGESSGEVSLGNLFTSQDNIMGINPLSLEDIAFLICRGGWPSATLLNGEHALDTVRYYYDAVTRSDVSRVDGINRNTELTKRLMRSYSRHQGAQATISTLVEDIRAFDESAADAKTISSYIGALKNGLECDAVIHLRNGSYGLVEIKLGGDKLIEEGASTLLSLASKIDTEKMKSPSFQMVLTATGRFAYRREDGVYVVPIGCLRE